MSRSRADREAAVHRVNDGAPLELVAHELGVKPATVRSWVDCWTQRGGAWNNRPLTPDETEMGYEIVEGTYSARVQRRDRGDARAGLSATLQAFLSLMHEAPSKSRDSLASAYSELADDAKARLAPALDAYLEAAELMDEVRRRTARALTIAMAEIREAA